jgi:hypothetical protein
MLKGLLSIGSPYCVLKRQRSSLFQLLIVRNDDHRLLLLNTNSANFGQDDGRRDFGRWVS